MNIAHFLRQSARIHADRIAIHRGKSAFLRYGELGDRAARLAGALAGLGVNPGDRVALFLENHPAYLEALYGVFHAGAVAVPLNARLHPRELEFILGDSGARIVLCSERTAGVLGEAGFDGLAIAVDRPEYRRLLEAEAVAIVARRGDELAWLFYTSGTTGQPKGAMLSHDNLTLATLSYLGEVDAVSAAANVLHCAPMSHGSGMYNFPHVLRGAGQIIPKSGGFDVSEIAELCDHHREVSFFAAPTMVQRLCRQAPADAAFAGLKLIVYGGGPMLTAQIEEAMARFGPKFAQIYGQGECPMTITRLPREEHLATLEPETYRTRLGSVGQPFGAVDVRIDGAGGMEVAGCAAGEILVRSAIVMLGYWQRPEATAEAIAGGWLRTGDIGYLDPQGYLHLVDRAKDVIISGGNNIYSREVEDVLIAHPGVAEVAIIGRPDPEWGERVVAVIGHGDGPVPAAAELDGLCRSRMSGYKRPKEYRFVTEIPKNHYGKIDKKILASLFSPDQE